MSQYYRFDLNELWRGVSPSLAQRLRGCRTLPKEACSSNWLIIELSCLTIGWLEGCWQGNLAALMEFRLFGGCGVCCCCCFGPAEPPIVPLLLPCHGNNKACRGPFRGPEGTGVNEWEGALTNQRVGLRHRNSSSFLQQPVTFDQLRQGDVIPSYPHAWSLLRVIHIVPCSHSVTLANKPVCQLCGLKNSKRTFGLQGWAWLSCTHL